MSKDQVRGVLHGFKEYREAGGPGAGGKEGTEAAGKAGRGRPGGAWPAVALDLDFFPTLNGKSLKGFKMGCNTEQFTF